MKSEDKTLARLVLLGLVLAGVLSLLAVMVTPWLFGAIAYVLFVLITLWSPRRRVSLVAATVSTAALIVADFFLTTDSMSRWVLLIHCSVWAGAMWVTALMIWQRRRADERSGRFFDLSLDLLCVASMDSRLKRVNPAFEKILGYTASELLGRPFVDLVHADDRPAVAAQLGKLSAGVPITYFEDRVRCKDGSYRWVAWTASPPTDEGLFYSAGRDITEHRRTEQQFRLAIESAPIGVVMVNDEGKVTLVNLQTEKLFGYSRDELTGQSIEILVPERFRNTHGGYCKNSFGESSARSMGTGPEFFARRKDGSEFPVEIGLGPLDTGEGALVLATIVDVTKRKEAEQTITSLFRISQRLTSTLDTKALLDALVEEAIRLMNAEGGCSGLRAAEGMICSKYFSASGVVPFEYCWPPGRGLPGWVLLHKVPYLTNDALTDAQVQPLLRERFGVRSALSTPIF